MANTTFNSSDIANASLSNGNLTVTSTSGLNNGGVRAVASITSGKSYFEMTFVAAVIGGDHVGVVLSTTALNGGEGATDGKAIVDKGGGTILVNNTTQGTLGGVALGTPVGIAVDAGARLIWFRITPSGNWNGSGTANPATGAGGVSISGLSGALFPYASVETTNDAVTANFGDSAFAGAVPAGFASGFPGTVAAPPGIDPSQPRWGVPTPTGTLQGAAAFSWDGSTWQPSGRAYASVATPTGVLRGVAPFSYSGTTWQTGGLSRPGVPTPTGTLDGVAVYTWSGSAWVPSGGVTTPTPSGTLQGVAAFYWDGTNWQPTGQAAPEVATPNGVLQGMAMFSWNGTTWAPTVSAPAIDLNFLLMTTLDPSITFTRASIGTYFDANGVMQTAGNNVPRFDYDPVTHVSRGLLIEELRTNLLLNSATLSTQSVTTTATATTLSFYGTGSVTLSGTSSGTTNGTGANTRVATTFTPTAGTLTLTVSGSVTNAQLEAGAFATSYIPTTTGALSRQPDIATLPSGSWRNAAAETYAADILMTTIQNTTTPRIVGSATSQITPLLQNSSLQAGIYDGVGFIATTNNFSLGAVAKLASTWSSSTATLCLNAGTVATAATFTAGFGAITTFQFLGDTAPTDQSNGYIRRFRYWPRVLSNTELQQVTT